MALLILPGLALAQRSEPTGILAVDLRNGLADEGAHAARAIPIFSGEEQAKKSLWLAGGLSVIVPGSGQFYAEAPLWRTILYGAIEAAGWTAYALYTSKGNQATTDFENYADAHWDVSRYIAWIGDNYEKWSIEDVDRKAAAEALAAIYRSNDPSLPGWERIDIEQLHKLERSVRGGFSHTLPPHGDQQYY
jgi:hypothetical protein